VEAAAGSLTVVNGSGVTLLAMPVSPSNAAVDIVVDADILEITVTGTEGVAATRVPVVHSGHIRISSLGSSSIAEARLSAPS
jgi:hypothetical protein